MVAVEAGNSFGMFLTNSGELKMAGVGETIDGVEIVSIAEDSAVVRSGGKLVTLTVEKTPEGQQ